MQHSTFPQSFEFCVWWTNRFLIVPLISVFFWCLNIILLLLAHRDTGDTEWFVDESDQVSGSTLRHKSSFGYPCTSAVPAHLQWCPKRKQSSRGILRGVFYGQGMGLGPIAPCRLPVVACDHLLSLRSSPVQGRRPI